MTPNATRSPFVRRPSYVCDAVYVYVYAHVRTVSARMHAQVQRRQTALCAVSAKLVHFVLPVTSAPEFRSVEQARTRARVHGRHASAKNRARRAMWVAKTYMHAHFYLRRSRETAL